MYKIAQWEEINSKKSFMWNITFPFYFLKHHCLFILNSRVLNRTNVVYMPINVLKLITVLCLTLAVTIKNCAKWHMCWMLAKLKIKSSWIIQSPEDSLVCSTYMSQPVKCGRQFRILFINYRTISWEELLNVRWPEKIFQLEFFGDKEDRKKF
jgi:hypothetical protein